MAIISISARQSLCIGCANGQRLPLVHGQVKRGAQRGYNEMADPIIGPSRECATARPNMDKVTARRKVGLLSATWC
jgi:hypothetical protein